MTSSTTVCFAADWSWFCYHCWFCYRCWWLCCRCKNLHNSKISWKVNSGENFTHLSKNFHLHAYSSLFLVLLLLMELAWRLIDASCQSPGSDPHLSQLKLNILHNNTFSDFHSTTSTLPNVHVDTISEKATRIRKVVNLLLPIHAAMISWNNLKVSAGQQLIHAFSSCCCVY